MCSPHVRSCTKRPARLAPNRLDLAHQRRQIDLLGNLVALCYFTNSNALVTSSDALVTISSFLLLVVIRLREVLKFLQAILFLARGPASLLN